MRRITSIIFTSETDIEYVVSKQIGGLLLKEQTTGVFLLIIRQEIPSEQVVSDMVICLRNKGCSIPESTKLWHSSYGVPFLKNDDICEQVFISLSSENLDTACLAVVPGNNSCICGAGIDIVDYKQVFAMMKHPFLTKGRLFSGRELSFAGGNGGSQKRERLAAILSAKEAAFKSIGPLLYQYSLRRPEEELYAEFIEFEIYGFDTSNLHAVPFGKTKNTMEKIGIFKIDVVMTLTEKRAFAAGMCCQTK